MTDNVLGLGDHLLSRIILDSDTATFKQIVRDELSANERDYYEFISEHLSRYDTLPDRDVILNDTVFNFSSDVIQPSGYYLDQISSRFKRDQGARLVDDYNALRIQGDNDGAADLLRARVPAIINSGGNSDIVSVEELSRKALQKQRDKQLGRGEAGILTGYAGLDADLMGLAKGDMLMIAGRVKQGKTQFALNMALNAWKAGAKILIVTMEMSPEQLNDRIQSILVGFNPRALRSPMISTRLYNRMESQIRGFDNMPPMNFMAGKFRKKPSDIARAASRLQPDLILIDGAYLLSPEDRNARTAKHEVLADVIGDIKAFSGDLGCVTLPTVQFNRNAAGTAKGKKVMDGDALSPENIAGTDAYAATTTTMIGIGGVQGAPNRRRLKQMASRESEGDYDAIARFEFSPPNFDELCTFEEYAELEAAEELESRRRTAEHFGL